MQANLYRVDPFPDKKLVGTVTLGPNGEAILSDGVEFLDRDVRDPLLDADKNPINLRNGQHFIQALPGIFKNPYLWAELVE